MSKPFNPFDDDPQPEEATENPTRVLNSSASAAAASARPERTELIERTRTAPRKQGLALEFEELADQGGDLRGASALGGEELTSDEFLTGMKRRDHEEALEKALRAQVQLGQAVTDTRVARTNKRPMYALAFGALVFVGVLILGGMAFNAYRQHAEHNQIEALQNAH